MKLYFIHFCKIEMKLTLLLKRFASNINKMEIALPEMTSLQPITIVVVTL